jgi:cytosine/adenosine deaminase-related metal-dependent hydrolase
MIVAAGTVITMDAERRIITDGALRLEGSRIVEVGKAGALRARFPAEPVHRFPEHVITPGFVDTHVHLAQALIRGCADDRALVEWLCDRVWVLQGHFTEDDGRVSARLCIAEMLRSGTTTFLESMLAHRYGFDGIAEVVRESGARGTLAKIVMDTPRYADAAYPMHPGMIEDRETGLAGTLEMHRRWHGAAEGRIRVWFGPRTPGAVTRELYGEIARLAMEHGLGMTMHLAEVREDREFMQRTYGRLPVEFAEEVGLVGTHVVLVHMVWITEPEIRTLARTGTHVSHNPSSNTKLASGICPVPALLREGVNVALGCDGGPSNNVYDLVREMKLAACLHKGASGDPLVVPAETALEMATLAGARALGLEAEIGSLEPGKKADLAVFDMRRLHLTPNPNPVSTLVYAAGGADVSDVMVDGRWVVRDSRLLTMNEDEIIRDARVHAAALIERAGVDVASRWPVR